MDNPVPSGKEERGEASLSLTSKTKAGKGSRRKAREAALQVLFLMEMNPENPFHQSLDLFLENFPVKGGLKPFFLRLVHGVFQHKDESDQVIQKHSENWRLERMSRVDYTILRMAVFELVHCSDIPPRVAINEAIDLGKQFGTEESGAFINGILDSILLERYGKTPQEEMESPHL